MNTENEKLIFTEDDLRYLKENYKRGNSKELAEKLGKDLGAVQRRLYRLGLCQRRIPAELIESTIKEFYKTKTIQELADELGVAKTTIRRYFRNMVESGEDEYMSNKHPYIHGDAYRPWTEHDLNILKKYYPREGSDCINRMDLFHSKSCTNATARQYGLKCFWLENKD